jgi:hypothetical protein
MASPMTDDPAARDAVAIERYLASCAEHALGAERTAILADRLTTLARSVALVSAACREPLFDHATAAPDHIHE